MNGNIIICDIDGCLNFYPDTFLRWVGLRFDIHKKDIDSLKDFLGKTEYKKIKFEYRTCGIKRNLETRKGITDMFRIIKKSGKKIWILTTRPTFEPVKGDTEYWLKNNKIIYDKLIFKKKEEKKNYIERWKEKIYCIVDDDINNAIYSAEQLKIPVFLFGDKQDKQKISSLIICVKSWQDIKDSFPNIEKL
ncbi:hypothetical protein AMJ49_04260 [Parcubacteria bacterium DG_74_2]|nr:MAG: hypothetical protein AMJ49_04260 [Parcubacteria bacterium DG_74_2]